jgi:hypothetical protein
MTDYTHPPFPAPEVSETPTICDLGCIERYTPKKLRNVELFKKIDFLSCHYEDAWTDEELFRYLDDIDEFFRKSLSGGLQILNWYSLMTWLEASTQTWEYSAAGNFGIDNEDFYSRYDLSIKDIWLSMSAANGEPVNESGFKYYEWMLKPYIGTNLIQRKILEKLEIDGEIVDWYENKSIVNGYSIVMDDFPGWEKAKLIIINSKLLKNAESILVSLRDSRCPTRLLLSDGGHLDRDYLSDITALKFEGVHICFQRYSKYVVKLFTKELLDDFIHKAYSSDHMFLVDYFKTVELSVDLELDGLSDRTVFITKTNFWPPRQIHLLPAYDGSSSKWEQAMTWEDHFTWGSIDVTNLVRTVLPYDELFAGEGWRNDITWERWSDWLGDQNETWHYNKPGVRRREYFENPNYIPSYEPSSGKSLYKPLVVSSVKRIHVEGVFNNKSQVINFWDKWELSYDEFLSPTTDQQPTKWKTVYFEHFHTVKSEVVDYSVGYDILYKHYSEENITLSSYRVNMWDEWALSNNVAVSPIEDENRKTIFFTHTPIPL